MLNVSRTVIEKLRRDRFLTDKQGKIILASYKNIKHHLTTTP